MEKEWWSRYPARKRVLVRNGSTWERGVVLYPQCDARTKRVVVRTGTQDCITGEFRTVTVTVTVTDPSCLKPEA